MRKVAIFCVRLYQWSVSPLFPPHCRFYPSCSEYAAVSIRRHGLKKGVALSLRRILRCHPFYPGGVDPVPDQEDKDQSDPQREMQPKQKREGKT
ncbi:MAG: membrane protein insertion efficiency factor YidD [Desulfohalobiaceae bacterium]|nr:membrane protein insertion efficiency factor YidD [Desulfohalobiaceae bacterium]